MRSSGDHDSQLTHLLRAQDQGFDLDVDVAGETVGGEYCTGLYRPDVGLDGFKESAIPHRLDRPGYLRYGLCFRFVRYNAYTSLYSNTAAMKSFQAAARSVAA